MPSRYLTALGRFHRPEESPPAKDLYQLDLAGAVPELARDLMVYVAEVQVRTDATITNLQGAPYSERSQEYQLFQKYLSRLPQGALVTVQLPNGKNWTQPLATLAQRLYFGMSGERQLILETRTGVSGVDSTLLDPSTQLVPLIPADGNRWKHSFWELTPVDKVKEHLHRMYGSKNALPADREFVGRIARVLDWTERDTTEQDADPNTSQWFANFQRRLSVEPATESDDWQEKDGVLQRPDGKFFMVHQQDPRRLEEVGSGTIKVLVSDSWSAREVLVQVREEPGTPWPVLAPAEQYSKDNPSPITTQAEPDSVIHETVKYPEHVYQKTNNLELQRVDKASVPVSENHRWVRLDWLRQQMKYGRVNESLALGLELLLRP